LNIKKNPIPSNLSIILDNIQADINLIENYQEPPLHRLFVKWLFELLPDTADKGQHPV
jgi:hypothetical protein